MVDQDHDLSVESATCTAKHLCEHLFQQASGYHQRAACAKNSIASHMHLYMTAAAVQLDMDIGEHIKEKS